MDLSIEERKQHYIQKVQEEYAAAPADINWWQHPSPSYYLTSRYAAEFNRQVVSGGPVLFRKSKKEGMVLVVLIIVASLLIYMVGKREFGIVYILILLGLLVVVLPILLNNKSMIRVSSEGIWLSKENKDISWDKIVLTYIKEVHQEDSVFSLIVHYCDNDADEFRSIEMELEGIVSPGFLAATIESARPA